MLLEFEDNSTDVVELTARTQSKQAFAVKPLARGWYSACRAAIEYVATLVLLILTAPLVLVAAVLIKCSSEGPAFYSQVRMGKDGRLFQLYKLRSMYHNCERLSGPCWSHGRDKRVTLVGRLLRVSHVDELPQLWNVLRGEMSLIGPRPERPEFVFELRQVFPRYCERLLVRPGISGLAQVQLPADSSLESVRMKLVYDLYYMQSMGAWLDLRIVISTMLKMCGVSFGLLKRVGGFPSAKAIEEAVSARSLGANFAASGLAF